MSTNVKVDTLSATWYLQISSSLQCDWNTLYTDLGLSKELVPKFKPGFARDS
jgi:hypothetical protein